jgi:poly(ADP-ribose) glycohydrolase ARH3
MVDLESKFLGSIIGSALGDAIGECAFVYRDEASLNDFLKQNETFSYTDDTAMAMGLAESIMRVKGIDQQDIGDTFRKNYEREPWRGYGPGPPAIFTMVKRTGISYVECARKLFGGEGSLGNGAAMRIAPVGLFCHRSESLYGRARISAEVTHTHPVGVDGAAVQATAVAEAVMLDPEKKFSKENFIDTLKGIARTEEIREKMILVRDMIFREALPEEAAEKTGRTVAVHESMPFAVYSFLRHPESFTDCLLCAILNGGDRDTLGAMAGAISGAYLGIDAIPSLWRKKLEKGDYIEKLARGLAGMKK